MYWELVPPRAIQETYLRDLMKRNPEPLSNARRSFLQYKCQRKMMPLAPFLVVQMASFFALPFIVLRGLWAQHFCRASREAGSTAVLFHSVPLHVPRSLHSEFQIRQSQSGFALTLGDIWFVMAEALLRHPFSFLFVAKILNRVATTRFSISKNDRAIIVSNEYSFTSALMSEWCHRQGLEQINIQHGTSLFNIRDSFSYQDRFYVWEEHFEKLFKNENVLAGRFVREPPPALECPAKRDRAPTSRPLLKYYLQAHTNQDLTSIANVLRRLSDRYLIVIRNHPFYGDDSAVRTIFQEFSIEPKEVSICDSIQSADYVASRYSAVLYQAGRLGVPIVVDDLSAPEFFQTLKDRDFVVFSQPHKKLSEFVG
jgi:hypothetical protein